MATLIDVIKHSPVWVWILFVFLIRRGVNALSDRKMRPRRLFVLPSIFFVWGIYTLTHEIMFKYTALAVMGISLFVGGAIGWVLWSSKPRLYSVQNSDLVIRPGTPLTLCFILMDFTTKFALTVLVAVYPAFYGSVEFTILLGVATGFFGGVFWGGTLNLFIPWYKLLKAEK